MRLFALPFCLIWLALPAGAQVPNVVTDVLPVHSLTASVMGDLGTPELLLGATADPHDFQMRPSQARAIADADLVIWVGPALTPWLADVTASRTPERLTSLTLLAIPDLPLRIEGDSTYIAGGGKDHSVGEHDHEPEDPHIWLDPLNAIRAVDAIAGALAAADPDNAVTYRENAAQTAARLSALHDRLSVQLGPARDSTLVAYHDAYRYFFTRYGLPLAGSMLPADGGSAAARQLSELRGSLSGADYICVLSEPGANPDLIATAMNGADHTVAELDPVGRAIAPGPAAYEELITTLAMAIGECARR